MMHKSKKSINKHLVEAILINICYFLVNITLFEPYLSVDDNMMSTRCYGVYTGEYGYDLTYINFTYGRLIQGLMRICNKIPWYTVGFYILLFVAFVLIAYSILEYFDRTLAWIIINIFLLFFSYDAYISIQFTQVAGLIGSIGIFVLAFSKTSIPKKIVGSLLFLFSCMIRYQMAQLVLLGSVCAFAIGGIAYIFLRKTKSVFASEYVSKSGLVIACVILVLAPKIPSGMGMDDKEYWSEYWNYNNIRVAIQDYQYPDYQENEEFYKSLGISENDLYLYHSWNTDVNTINYRKGKQIIALQEQLGKASGFGTLKILTSVLDIEKTLEYFKIFPLALLKIDTFGALICLVMVIVLGADCARYNKMICIGIPLSVILAMNYYMYICNRYLQHRVDVGVCSMGYLLLVFFIQNTKVHIRQREHIQIMLCVLCILICGEHHYQSYNYLVDSNILENNKCFYEQTYQNENSLYSIVAQRSEGANPARVFYGALDVPKLGIGKNIYFGNNSYGSKRLKDRNIDDIYMYMVNRDNAYIVMQDGNLDIDHWICYFNEHLGEQCTMVESMDMLGKKIYRVYTESYYENLSLPVQFEESQSLVSEVESRLDNDIIQIKGNIYLNNESGFQQETYLQITDGDTGLQKIYLLTRNEDESKKKDDAGRYSYVDESIELPDFYSDDDEIAIVVEQDDKYYKWIVDVTHM